MSRIESSLRCSAQIKSLPEFVRAEYVAAADRIAELEAELVALAARIAGGVRVECNVYNSALGVMWDLSEQEHAALLPYDGQAVTVIGDKP